MGEKFNITFLHKWSLLNDFSRGNFLRHSKHLTRLLFIVLDIYQIWVTTSNLVLTSINASPTSGNNLHLLLSFKRSKFSGSSQSPQKYLLHLKLSTFKPLSSHSFLKQDFFTSSISESCPITFTNINFFSGLSIVSKHDVSIICQESWWEFNISQHISYFFSSKWGNCTLLNYAYFTIKKCFKWLITE